MSTKKLNNITVKKFQAFLDLVLCKYTRTKGGHEVWVRSDLLRPIIIQTHVKPIPEFIVLNNLRTLGYSKSDFFDIMDNKKEVIRTGNVFELKEVKKAAKK